MASFSGGSIGFYRGVETPDSSFHGGLLVLNENARPLEFHCSAPIRPARAQRVLYGTTLKDHLLGDQIPSALVQKSKEKPGILIVNDLGLIKIRSQISIPLVCIQPRPENSLSIESDSVTIAGTQFVSAGEHHFAIDSNFPDDQIQGMGAIELLSRTVDLDEPFERLELAMNEMTKPTSQAG